MKIIGEVESTAYGKTLIGELASEPDFIPVGSDERAAENYKEISERTWQLNFSK